MILQSLPDVFLLLVEPLSAAQLIAAGVLVVSGVFNRMFRTYITYVLTHPNGSIYVGRTSGLGEPAKILKRRLYGHDYIKQGFENSRIDRAMQGRNSRAAIRGREQQMIDYYGGIGSANLVNRRRGVAKWNPLGESFHEASDEHFGNLTAYTGY